MGGRVVEEKTVFKEIESLMNNSWDYFIRYRFHLTRYILSHKYQLTKSTYISLVRSTNDIIDLLNKIIWIKRENLRLLYKLLDIKTQNLDFLPLVLLGMLILSLNNNKS